MEGIIGLTLIKETRKSEKKTIKEGRNIYYSFPREEKMKTGICFILLLYYIYHIYSSLYSFYITIMFYSLYHIIIIFYICFYLFFYLFSINFSINLCFYLFFNLDSIYFVEISNIYI